MTRRRAKRYHSRPIPANRFCVRTQNYTATFPVASSDYSVEMSLPSKSMSVATPSTAYASANPCRLPLFFNIGSCALGFENCKLSAQLLYRPHLLARSSRHRRPPFRRAGAAMATTAGCKYSCKMSAYLATEQLPFHLQS